MNQEQLQFQQDDLMITVTTSPGRGLVMWHGCSDARDPGVFLTPVFRNVLPRLKGCQVTIDFSRLEYMNSATVSPIIALLKDLDKNSIQSRILFSDDDWQRTHLRCLRTIARVLRHVEVAAI